MARMSSNPNANQSNSSNPYSTLRLCCTTVRTKEHAQLIGIVSLSVFVCLIVVSYSLFGAFSVAYICSGIVIYGFLMESLLRKPNKLSILGYLAFELLQVLFYTSLVVYILILVIYPGSFDWSCNNLSSSSVSTTTHSNRRIQNSQNSQNDSDCVSKTMLIESLIFFIFLITMKLYFTRVMFHLYKFYAWIADHSSDLSASYVNNRGVQINVDDRNIFPPPPWTPGSYPTTGVDSLPTYDEATSTQKPPLADEAPRAQNQQNGDNQASG